MNETPNLVNTVLLPPSLDVEFDDVKESKAPASMPSGESECENDRDVEFGEKVTLDLSSALAD